MNESESLGYGENPEMFRGRNERNEHSRSSRSAHNPKITKVIK